MKGVQHGETHFNLTVVSSKFEGVALIERHRLVNEILKDHLDPTKGGTVHAL